MSPGRIGFCLGVDHRRAGIRRNGRCMAHDGNRLHHDRGQAARRRQHADPQRPSQAPDCHDGSFIGDRCRAPACRGHAPPTSRRCAMLTAITTIYISGAAPPPANRGRKCVRFTTTSSSSATTRFHARLRPCRDLAAYPCGRASRQFHRRRELPLLDRRIDTASGLPAQRQYLGQSNEANFR
jgi:hypothetical protein